MEKLSIRAIDDQRTFTVAINPASFKHDHGINYTTGSGSQAECGGKRAIGTLSPRLEFSDYQTESVSFNITLDSTGVVPSDSSVSVDDQIDKLKDVVYRYVGKKHEPSVVQIKWGTFVFKGRLKTLNINYTLFAPSGKPLRAAISLSFERYLEENEQAFKAKRSSPDLTHIIEFRAGDSLPLLCHNIYQDSSYYQEVARHNNLDNCRDIRPGTRLYFPPLD
ncbi:CIS tube protein [Oceanospirillum sediminis]|uniref:Peptidoglycan-binding protein n=1 Tax=Oceanospirillum sediminis TaxID=2760088 RepID=A0A839INU7_9GAMM|nr:peptidoglycan-binding protein [Oceanospirillum sediminis]MBB1487163.1 peptidoglycan-binding protein [Oceanospirillum sediminis]